MAQSFCFFGQLEFGQILFRSSSVAAATIWFVLNGSSSH